VSLVTLPDEKMQAKKRRVACADIGALPAAAG